MTCLARWEISGTLLPQEASQGTADPGPPDPHPWPYIHLSSAKLIWGSLVAQRLKPLPAMWETCVQSLGWEDPLEKEMATHSSILAWRIPWTEEPGGLQSMDRKESDTTERLHFHFQFRLKLQWSYRNLRSLWKLYSIIHFSSKSKSDWP